MQEERGKSAVTGSGRIASCSKAICATVLAIASEESQKGHTPRKMTFDDRAFEFIPWAQPLSDPRKARITVKQLLNHTSGICPEATGACLASTNTTFRYNGRTTTQAGLTVFTSTPGSPELVIPKLPRRSGLPRPDWSPLFERSQSVRPITGRRYTEIPLLVRSRG